MFDEYLEPPCAERPVSLAQAVQASVNLAGTPSSTTIDQDTPSPSILPSSSVLQSHSLHQGVAAESTFMKDDPVAPVDNNPLINVFALEPHSKASSSEDISSTESTYVSQTLHHPNKWSKDHPLDNVIGNPSRLGRQNRGQGMNPRRGGAAGYGGGQTRVGNANSGGQDNTLDDDVDEKPVQDLALNVDNVFQADDYDAFDFDVDEAPTTQTMFMANLSSADPNTDEAGPSYDSGILSEVQEHDHYQDAVCAHHEEHAMHDSVQLNHVVDSHVDNTSDSNMIPYD
nr:hypothetical protein [Tanacetum cinerariifolium]